MADNSDLTFLFSQTFKRYPEEILEESNLEELYEKVDSHFSFLVFFLMLIFAQLSVGGESHFYNGINMSVWGTNYAWGKLREKVITIYINNLSAFFHPFRSVLFRSVIAFNHLNQPINQISPNKCKS